MELLDSNLSSQAINAQTESQDKGPSDSTLLLSSFVGTLLMGLWITPNWLLNLVFLRKSYFEESGFIHPSSALVWLLQLGEAYGKQRAARPRMCLALHQDHWKTWFQHSEWNIDDVTLIENETTRDFKFLTAAPGVYLGQVFLWEATSHLFSQIRICILQKTHQICTNWWLSLEMQSRL